MTYLTDRVLEDVLRERSKQDKKWGEQTKTKDAWLIAIGEEFGEACKAVIDEQSQDYVKELIHTAATCVCAIEDLLRQHRKNREIK